MPFGPLSQTRLFSNSQSFLGWWQGGDANSCMRECVWENEGAWGGEVIGNTSKRDESSWLCMKVEFAFFSGYCISSGFFRLLVLNCL